MEESNQVKKVFDRIDGDGDGKITPIELAKSVRALDAGVTDGELDAMVREMDSNRDGFVDAEEFAEFHRSGGDDGGESLREAFNAYDLNKNGLISAKELSLVMEKLGEDGCGVEECERMVRSVDADGDGFVNFEEFKLMMSGGIKKNQQQ